MTPFDTTTSSTFKSSDTAVRISYGSGSARGTVGSDTVQMGGFTVQGQTLGTLDVLRTRLGAQLMHIFCWTAIIHTLTDGLKVNNVSGLMGLGFTGIATTKCVLCSVRANS